MSTRTDTNEKKSLTQLLSEQNMDALQALNLTMAEAMRESYALLSDILQTRKLAFGNLADDPLGVNQSFLKLGQGLAANPDQLLKANTQLWQGLMASWTETEPAPRHQNQKPDRRFSDPEWSVNPIFQAMKRTYELNTQWLMSLIDTADNMSDTEKRKARFFAQQTIDAYAPTNFFATNPEVLRRMIETKGISVLDGLKQARKDIKRGKGKLTISQTDESVFKLGESIAKSPGKVVFRNDLIELIQYEPTTKTVYTKPLLIFPPWINKFYILDLRESNSMVAWLRDKGYTVFMVSWRSADDTTRHFTWDDYVQQGGYGAVEAALKAAGTDSLNAVGYCIGGTLLTCLLSHMSHHKDNRINAATFFACQVDFELAGDLLVFTDDDALDHIDELLEENKGVMPGESMAETFNWLRPIDLVWRYVIDNYMLGKKPRPFDLLYWNADQTNIPGPVHRAYLKNLYADNALVKGAFDILGHKVNPKSIDIPTFVQASRDDHICPYQSVYRTSNAFGGPSSFVLAGSGHIAGVINHPDANKYQYWTCSEDVSSIEEWIGKATEHPGSWWPHWHQWLYRKSGKKIPARQISGDTLGDAPGEYVKKRLKDIRQARGLK